MLTAENWNIVTEGIRKLSTYVFEDPRVDSELLRAEGFRYLTRLVAGGWTFAMGMGDPDNPRFVQPLDANLQWGLPAVDSLYLTARVRGGNTYRIWGDRGSARVFDVEVWDGDFCHMSSIKLESKCPDFNVEDGRVEFILSSEERDGNWLKLPDGDGTVVVRQYFYDTYTEDPGIVYIERVDGTYPPPPLTEAEIKERARDLEHFLADAPAVCLKAIETYYAAGPDTVDFAPLAFGFADLQFGRGHYRCRPDEAVILETPDPGCFYWNYQLSNHFWEALDWNVRQTSLNGHEAVIDDDGIFRAVISHADPGVPNWLDTAGREAGLIAARYYKPGAFTPPTLRVVPLDKVREHLPRSTPEISPAERQESLRRRMIGARRTLRDH